MKLSLDSFSSPIGTILLAAHNDVLYSLDFAEYEQRMQTLLARYSQGAELVKAPVSSHITTAVAAYFAGNLDALSSLKTAEQGTAFQQLVWAKLREIPPAHTWSYKELAHSVGNHSASRAVGMANAKNPIALVIPCHRVIGADGAVSGYAGGIERKRWLLAHEKAHG